MNDMAIPLEGGMTGMATPTGKESDTRWTLSCGKTSGGLIPSHRDGPSLLDRDVGNQAHGLGISGPEQSKRESLS